MLVWDEKKNADNKTKHGLSFEDAYDFDWESSIRIDRSRVAEDGEIRLAQIGWLYGELHTIILTHRDNDIRIISLRRANDKEAKIYAKES